MTPGRCEESCMTGDGCTCQSPAVAAELQRVSHRHRHDGLVTDEAGRISFRRLPDPPQWYMDAVASMLSLDDGAASSEVMANCTRPIRCDGLPMLW